MFVLGAMVAHCMGTKPEAVPDDEDSILCEGETRVQSIERWLEMLPRHAQWCYTKYHIVEVL